MAAWKGPVFSETVPYDTTVADESLRYAADLHMQDACSLRNADYNYYDPAVVKASRDTINRIPGTRGYLPYGY